MKTNHSRTLLEKIICLQRKISLPTTILFIGIVSVLTLICLPGCARKSLSPFPPSLEDKPVTIHVAIYGGHSGIILPNSTMPDDLRRLTSRFNAFRYIEFGWGDEEYYRDPETTVFIAVKAALWPTASVLHLIGINEDMEEYAAGPSIYRIELSSEGFFALCNSITATFSRDKKGNSIALGPDPVFIRHTLFYQARPKFFFPRTCNTWTAKALKTAGMPISTWASICVKNLARNIAIHSRLITPAEEKERGTH